MIRNYSRRVVLGLCAVSIASAGIATTTGVANAADPDQLDSAVGYLATLQFESGGFDAPDGYAGFLTADIALAIAQAGQSSEPWSEEEALLAVQAVTTNGNDALDYLDDQADGVFGALSSGKAAQLVILASALGIDPTTFDPQTDGATDLVTAMDAGAPSFGSIYTAPLGVLANAVLGRAVSLEIRDYIVSQQAPDGSFGDSPDTTGLAIAALVAAGGTFADETILLAVQYLTTVFAPSGGFMFDGVTSASSTAMARVGLHAAGFDTESSCWRDLADPGLESEPYASPSSYLVGLHADSGTIADPSDWDAGYATAQAVQGLSLGFVPQIIAEPVKCDDPDAEETIEDGDGGVTIDDAVVVVVGGTDLPATGSSNGLLVLVAFVLVSLGALLIAVGGVGRRAAS